MVLTNSGDRCDEPQRDPAMVPAFGHRRRGADRVHHREDAGREREVGEGRDGGALRHTVHSRQSQGKVPQFQSKK